jgi:hypothetical protein
LNRDRTPTDGDFARQARDASAEMAIFAKVIEATRANLNVMNRLRELRGAPLEYSEVEARGWERRESGHGDH